MWSSLSRTVFPNLRNMVVQERESHVPVLVISAIRLHTGRRARRLAKTLLSLVPRRSPALVGLEHAADEFQQTLQRHPAAFSLGWGCARSQSARRE